MREIYEKYYTVRLFSCPDLHFAPTIIDIPGEYDTEEEARAAAEPEFQKTVSYNDRGESYSWFEVQVFGHYKKATNENIIGMMNKISDLLNENDLLKEMLKHTTSFK